MDVHRAELRRAVVMQQAVRQRAEPVRLVDDQAGQRSQVLVVDPPLQQLRRAAQTGQRVLHLVREAAQGGRQRRAGRRRFGQRVHFQQQAVLERLQRDVRADFAAAGRGQQHPAPLRRPLFRQHLRRLRHARAGIVQQQPQRLSHRAAEPQLQAFDQGGVEPAQAQVRIDQGQPGRHLLRPCPPRQVAHCTIMVNVSTWCKLPSAERDDPCCRLFRGAESVTETARRAEGGSAQREGHMLLR